ncbi:heavy metal transporter [Tamlana nanhaiensis]|uniref:Heavy metal transporter n=1 Tax=Neotamlana nanhaiensis TaxID=1382798 RepID=A0A0D7VZ22_9FLAO|nr:heavy metal-associated domain-containing protein [Tamlana nanhaiensis]KJD31693.1 heavy metal transporter [Tamlana nanhaiensis]
MKYLKFILMLVLTATFFVSCKNETKQPEVKTVEVATAKSEKTLDPNATYAKAEFTIDGMTCALGCAAQIQKKIAKMDGVKSAKVDFDKKLAMVEYDNAKVTPTSLTEAVATVSNTYKVNNMKTVDAFSSEKTCGEDCKKACCTKTEGEKMACKPDCKMACCAKKA